MSNTAAQQKEQILFHYQPNSTKTHHTTREVRQDKATPRRSGSAFFEPQYATPQPYGVHTASRPASDRNAQTSRMPKHHGSQKRRVKEVSGCISPATFEAVERMRDQGGTKLSRSSVVGSLITQGVQKHTDMHYGALLEPVVKAAIQKEMHAFRTLFQWLLVRIAFDTNQTRSLVTNMLSRQPGISKEARDAILLETARSARTNIFGKSPQLTELIQELDMQLGGEAGTQAPN